MNKRTFLQKITELEIGIFDLNYKQINKLQVEIIGILISASSDITSEMEEDYLKAIQELSLSFENKDYLLFRDILIYRIIPLLKQEELEDE